MQDRFKLASRGKYCMRSLRPFIDGETFQSLLVEASAYKRLVSEKLIELERQQTEAAAAAAAQAASREAAKEAAKAAAEGKPVKPEKPAKAGAKNTDDDIPAGVLRRIDLGAEAVTEADRKQAIVFWKTVFTVAKSKKKRQAFPIDAQGLLDLFLKLEEDIQAGGGPAADDDDPAQRDRIQLRYVVALMLIRKRKLRLIEFRTDKGGKEWMVVMQAAGTRRLRVRVIPITAKDRTRLKGELSETLGLGDDVLSDAPAAGSAGAAATTPVPAAAAPDGKTIPLPADSKSRGA